MINWMKFCLKSDSETTGFEILKKLKFWGIYLEHSRNMKWYIDFLIDIWMSLLHFVNISRYFGILLERLYFLEC